MTSRTDDIKEIRALLKTITGMTWSVRGSTGTAYSWINISTPPRRQVETGEISRTINLADAFLLGDIVGRGAPVHHQGHSVSPEARDGLIATLRDLAAEGRTFDLATAEAKIAEARQAAKHTAEAKVADALRKDFGRDGLGLSDWRLADLASDVAHPHSLPTFEGRALVLAELDRRLAPAALELDASASAFLALAEG